MPGWTLLSNHGYALLCVARDPGLTLREIGDCVGVTERAAHKLVNDLVGAGYLDRERVGTRSRYHVHPDVSMGHPLVQDHWVGELLAVLAPEGLRHTAPRVSTEG